jgi:hypothetical protein
LCGSVTYARILARTAEVLLRRLSDVRLDEQGLKKLLEEAEKNDH